MAVDSNSTSPSEKPLWHFLFASSPGEEEIAYRNYYIDSDTRQFVTIIYATTALLVGMTLIDLPNWAEEPELIFGAVIRALLIACALLLIRIMRLKQQPKIIDGSALAFSFLTALSILMFHFVSDVTVARMVSMVTIYLFVSHIALPTYGLYMMWPALLLFLGETALLFSSERPDIESQRSYILMIYFFSECMALLASAAHHRARYQGYSISRQVKTLSGLLPICSGCKKIRNDQGYYQQIEQYITEHSSAEFSHGVCPECIEVLYPEYGKRQEAKNSESNLDI